MLSALTKSRTGLPRPLQVFWKLTGFLWLVCGAIIGVNRFILHWTAPYNTPFYPFEHFTDFWAFHDRFDHYHQFDFYSTTAGCVFSYPAPLSLVYELFFITNHNQHSIFTIVTTLPLIGLGVLLAFRMVAKGISKLTSALFVGSCLLLSYPLWIEYLLGNIEISVFLITAFGILAWLRGNFYLAAALIGVAGSMKIFPFVFLGLLLSQKKYRQFAFGFLTAAVLYPISIWMACRSIISAIPQMRASSAKIGGLLLNWHWVFINFDHSLFAMYKQGAHLLGYSNMRTAHQLSVYTGLVAVAGIALYFLAIRRLPLLNQLLGLCIAAIILPPMSNDYTLMYLYLPFSLLVLSAIQESSSGTTRPGVFAAFVCFGLLFAPESEIIIRHATIGGQFKTLVLLALLYIAIKYPFALPSEQAVEHPIRAEVGETISVS